MSTVKMPDFEQDINLPARKGYLIVFRYYAPCIDGRPDSWQTPVVLPDIILDDVMPLYITPYFPVGIMNGAPSGGERFDPTPYERRQEMGGFDQHAQYYQCNLPFSNSERKITVKGAFQKVGYFSIVTYHIANQLDGQDQLYDYQLHSKSNPYIPGNLSVFSYGNSDVQHARKNSRLPVTERIPKASAEDRTSTFPLSHPAVTVHSGADIPRSALNQFYPVNQEMAATRFTEENTPNGCSRGYLNAILFPWQKVAILRIKVPHTFINSDTPDTIFGNYQCRELSISSNVHSIDNIAPVLDFWTVSSRMLNDYVDADGYAYVFFASNDYVSGLVNEQNISGQKKPPTLEWGRYKGYVLGYPDYSIIIRYRAPADSWQGSPANNYCAIDDEDMILHPASKGELGEYLPELYADTMDAFKNGELGAVNQNTPWPGEQGI